MKHLYTPVLFFLLLFGSRISGLQAQNAAISLQIDHRIGNEPLEFGNIYSGSQGAFMVTRLSYYLSGLEIIHDGGQHQAFPDVYLLVHGDQSSYPLGLADIQSIEGVAFNIGVDSVNNHGDPALWPEDHPLAYQTPSMHWGWTSGYRFLAMEGLLDGNQDGNPEKVWEFHVVGDELLTHVEVVFPIPIPASPETVIPLEADYSLLFNGVSMDNILHGSGSLIQKLMSNFVKGPVFTPGQPVSAIEPVVAAVGTSLRIIGANAGPSWLIETDVHGSDARLILTDMAGHLLRMQELQPGTVRTEWLAPGQGTFVLALFADGRLEACIPVNGM